MRNAASFLIVACSLSFFGCSKGPHGSQFQANQTKYQCEYAASFWQVNRTIAICDTQAECNEICSKLLQQ